jgi:hypothetical protein
MLICLLLLCQLFVLGRTQIMPSPSVKTLAVLAINFSQGKLDQTADICGFKDLIIDILIMHLLFRFIFLNF